MTSRVIDRDRGARALLRRLTRPPVDVRAGVFEGTLREDGTDNATVAAAVELGLGRPTHPFVRAWADAPKGLRDRAARILDAYVGGRITIDDLERELGEHMAQGIRLLTPVQTGQLRDAVTHRSGGR